MKAFDTLGRPQLFQDIHAAAVWVLVALRGLCNRTPMFPARLWFLTCTVVRQVDNLGSGLFRRSYDAQVAEWHEELNEHQWAERLTCNYDDPARTSISSSHNELNDINQVTTSSLASALRRRALQLHPKKEVTLLRLQGKYSSRDLRAALLGDWKAPERLVTSARYLGALRTIEGTMTTVQPMPNTRNIIAVESLLTFDE